MAGGRKAAHVHPDLGDDHLGGALADTGNGHSRRSWSSKGAITLSTSASIAAIWAAR